MLLCRANITFVAIAGNSCFENILVATRVLFTTSYVLGFERVNMQEVGRCLIYVMSLYSNKLTNKKIMISNACKTLGISSFIIEINKDVVSESLKAL